MSKTDVQLIGSGGGGGSGTMIVPPWESAYLDESGSVKFPDDSIITVGYDGTYKGRGALKFRVPNQDDSTVFTSVTLRLYIDTVVGTPTISFYEMAYPWRQENLDWTNSSNGRTWFGAGMQADFDYYTPAITSISTTGSGYVDIDLTAYVNAMWTASVPLSLDLAMIADDEVSTNYATLDGFPSSHPPYLIIEP